MGCAQIEAFHIRCLVQFSIQFFCHQDRAYHALLHLGDHDHYLVQNWQQHEQHERMGVTNPELNSLYASQNE